MSERAVPGARAPGFRLPLEGGGFSSIGDLVLGGGGVLLFLKAVCPASELVASHLGPLGAALAKEERQLLAVVQEDEETARAFRAEQHILFPVAYETAPYAVSDAYGIGTVPTLLVIDGAGVIAARMEGFVKSEYLALGDALEQALALAESPHVLDRSEELPAVKPG